MSNQLKESLKAEVEEILKHYGIPFEDRTLVLEKIDSAVVGAIEEERGTFVVEIDKVKDEIDRERDNVKHEVERLKEGMSNHLSVIKDDAAEASQEAYERGYDAGIYDGMSRIRIQPNGLTLILGLGLVALALMVAIGQVLNRVNIWSLLKR